jgi:hypothetical protein
MLLIQFVVIGAVASVHPISTIGGGACTDDLGCSLNGICVQEKCVCDAHWTHKNCGMLKLLPAKIESGLRNATSSSWGGQVVRSGSFYLMYAAIMAHNCGLKSWTSNSYVALSVANEPLGPYTATQQHQREIFSHNPTIFSPLNSTYILAQIGCGEGHDKKPPLKCKNGSTPGIVPLVASSAPKGCDQPHFTGAAAANSPEGPWAKAMPLALSPANGSSTWHDGTAFTNPAFAPLGNGSVLLAYSTGQNHAPTNKHIGVAYGNSWAGPFTDLTPAHPIFDQPTFNNSEDPHLFIDGRGNYHLLAHTGYNRWGLCSETSPQRILLNLCTWFV